jgi:hypothetical protein
MITAPGPLPPIGAPVRSRLADPTPRGPPGAPSANGPVARPSRDGGAGPFGCGRPTRSGSNRSVVQLVTHIAGLWRCRVLASSGPASPARPVGAIGVAPSMLFAATVERAAITGRTAVEVATPTLAPVSCRQTDPVSLLLSLRSSEVFNRTGHPVHPDTGCRPSVRRGESLVRLAVDPRPTARPPPTGRPRRGPSGESRCRAGGTMTRHRPA